MLKEIPLLCADAATSTANTTQKYTVELRKVPERAAKITMQVHYLTQITQKDNSNSQGRRRRPSKNFDSPATATKRALSTNEDRIAIPQKSQSLPSPLLEPVRSENRASCSNHALYLSENSSGRRTRTMNQTQISLARRAERSNIRNVASRRGKSNKPVYLEYHDLESSQREVQGRRCLEGAQNQRCIVCDEAFPATIFPFLSTCHHLPRTCPNCYAKWTSAQLAGSGWRDAKCPETKCNVRLTYFDIQHLTTPETFKQYDKFITRAALNEDPDFRWCQMCDSGQIHISGEEGNIFTCASCGHKACVIHESTWHPGETCAEYDHRAAKTRLHMVQDTASVATLSKFSKKCPGPGCAYNIEKNEGCDHMTCSQCHYQFCWLCLCNYNEVRRLGNSAHAENCGYHPSRLE